MNPWSVYAHSVTGLRHQRDGKANQDRYRYWTERNRPVLVLGDGAGSKDRAGEGAEIAVTAAGSDIVAFSCGKADAELRSADLAAAEKLLTPIFADAFDRVNQGILKNAASSREDAESYSVSLTATVIEARWIGCTTEGDVAVVSGRPGHWRLVNKIFKHEEKGRPGSRNATNLLPYRTPTGSSRTDFARRQRGDLTLMFCDGALGAFLIDTTPSASVGSYQPNTAVLDAFFHEFMRSVRAERARRPAAARTGLMKLTSLIGTALRCFSPSPNAPTPTELLKSIVDELVHNGEQDDITVLAAID